MLHRLWALLKWIVLLPILVAVVLLAVANDHGVTVHLNPFDAEDPVLRADLALYQLGFLMFALGALVGGLVAWSGQRRYRRRARDEHQQAALWQARAERNERRRAEAEPQSGAAAFLPRPGRG